MTISKSFISAVVLTVASVSNAYAEWNVEKSGVDPITDESINYISTMVNDGYRDRYVLVRCNETDMQMDIIFGFDEYMKSERISVTYRIDKNKPVAGLHNASTRGTSAFMYSSKEVEKYTLIQNMIDGNMLHIRGLDHNRTPVTYSVSLVGFTKAYNEGCNS